MRERRRQGQHVHHLSAAGGHTLKPAMPNQLDILLVDDDERLCIAASKVLSAETYSVVSARSAREALEVLKQQSVALVVSDLRLPDLDGLALLKKIRELQPHAEVVMITGHGSVEQAVEAMRCGAYDFIQKPLDSTALLKTVAKALEKQRLTSENRRLRDELQQQHDVESLIGQSPAMQAIKELIRQIAPADVNVLIQGESGTGKEIVADALHHLSERREQRLLKISCAAIPEALLESELFGHERGAFTDAHAARAGKFELADGGTLMLDEIAEMSPQLQAKLLRVLQDGRFQRLGGAKEIQVNVRLLCATHADIPKAIEKSRFRQDLYYRINTVQIVLPPLRERREDIPLLAGHFLRRFASRMNKDVRALAPAALDQLLAHPWPGNVRELEHAMQRAVVLAQDHVITGFVFAPKTSDWLKAVSAAQNASCVSIPIGTTVDEGIRRLVLATIEQCAGNKLKAARLLGLSPRSMYRHFSNGDAGQTGSDRPATLA
jgi:two-component system, NtrC family, response regulator HydG